MRCRYPGLVVTVTVVQLLSSLASLAAALASAPSWDTGGGPALARVQLVTAQLVVASAAECAAISCYYVGRHRDLAASSGSVKGRSSKYMVRVNLRRGESRESHISSPRLQ